MTPRTHRSIRSHARPFALGGVLLLAAVGCGSSDRVLATAALPAPVEVLATSPAARETGVIYDTPISVDFAQDMDASSFSTASVLLKLDTQRVPLLLSYDVAQRRLHLYPQAELRLRRTYTVELTSAVSTAEGRHLGADGWFFQFTTNSARRPLHPQPAPGVSNESPFVMLSWDSTEAGVGAITYEVWAGLDSAAVAARVGSPVATLSRARWLPNARWPLDSRVYWAITVRNAVGPEQLDGAVQSFATLPSGLPEDSLLVKPTDYAYNYINFGANPVNPYQYCSSDSVVSTSGTQGWMRFSLAGLPADARIASARLEVYVYGYDVSRLPTTTMTLWSSRFAWSSCRQGPQFRESLPIQDQAVAFGRQESDRRLIYSSDLLAAHVEATARYGGFFGYEFVSTQRLAYVTPHSSETAAHPYLKIHYFRTPARPELALRP